MESFLIITSLLAIVVYVLILHNRYQNLKRRKSVIIWELNRISTNPTMHSIIEEDILGLIPEREYVSMYELFKYRRIDKRLDYLSNYVSNLKSAANRIVEFDFKNSTAKIDKLKSRLIKETNVSKKYFSDRQNKIFVDAYNVYKRLCNLTNEQKRDKAFLLKIYSEGICKLSRVTSIKAFK